MNIFDRLISVFAPFECLACGVEGKALCLPCQTTVAKIPSRCYRCRKLTKNYRTCKSCRSSSALFSIIPTAEYSGVSKELVTRLKFYGAQAIAEEIALSMAKCANDYTKNTVVIPIPTASSRVRQRGYDQAKLIAKSFARHCALPYLDCLTRVGQSHQVGAKRHQRTTQLKGAYRLKSGYNVQNIQILLIDDVLTTGSTLESASICLKGGGAGRIQAQVFAQA